MIVIEGENSLHLSGQAWLVEDKREIAWAAPHVIPNAMHAWVLGKFVGTGTPNDNGHIFDVDELRVAKDSVIYTPMNMLHSPHDIMGAFIANELVYPTGETDTEETLPYLDTLGVFWKYYFPDAFKVMESAHAKGQLAFSMEAIPESVTCAATNGCGETFPYMGRVHESYCAHLQESTPLKKLNKPHFLAGAIVVPPAKPAWKAATVSELTAEAAYDQVAKEMPHLDAPQWESMMNSLLIAAFPPKGDKPDSKSSQKMMRTKPHAYDASGKPGTPCEVCGLPANAAIHQAKKPTAKSVMQDPVISRIVRQATRG